MWSAGWQRQGAGSQSHSPKPFLLLVHLKTTISFGIMIFIGRQISLPYSCQCRVVGDKKFHDGLSRARTNSLAPLWQGDARSCCASRATVVFLVTNQSLWDVPRSMPIKCISRCGFKQTRTISVVHHKLRVTTLQLHYYVGTVWLLSLVAYILGKESLPRRAIFRGAYRLRLQPHSLNLTNVYWVSQNLGINQCESASRLILIVLCL